MIDAGYFILIFPYTILILWLGRASLPHRERQARRLEKLARKHDEIALRNHKSGFYGCAKDGDAMAESIRARARELRGKP